MTDVVVLGAARTPLGSFQGCFASMTAPQLGAVAIQAALERSGLDADHIDDVVLGNVLGAGVGQAPARQAALAAGLPSSTNVTTINKVCSSGLKAVMLCDQAIRCGDVAVCVAGGMESMTNAPYLLPKARDGYRMGHGQLVDSMIADGLWDPYQDYHMGNAGELCAREHDFTREAQDAYAVASYERAQVAQSAGDFRAEIASVAVPQRRGDPISIDNDEEPTRVKLEKLPSLRAAFAKEGTITAGNASTINDGAAALIVASRAAASELGAKPMARIVAQATYSHQPEWFTTAPAGAIQAVCAKAGLSPSDIDLYEINEAFACVTLHAMREHQLSADKVNVRGGAIALGHPIGASGARIVVTLLHAMQQRNVRYGLATLCNGGGEATAVIFERMESA